MGFKRMSSAKFDALSMDFDRQEGKFTMPPELTTQPALVRMDVLADWMDGMNDELLKASINYFIELCNETCDEESTFERHYAAFLQMLSGLNIRPAYALKENCSRAYSCWKVFANLAPP